MPASLIRCQYWLAFCGEVMNIRASLCGIVGQLDCLSGAQAAYTCDDGC